MLDPSPFCFEHGDHACVFYRSEDSLIEILTAFVLEGLEKNERCFCAENPRIRRLLMAELCEAGINVEKEIQRGALEFRTEREKYFPDGKFRPDAVSQALSVSAKASLRLGFSGLRSTGDLSWAFENGGKGEPLLRYEQILDTNYPLSGATGLCCYPAMLVPPTMVSAIRDAHKMNVLDSMDSSVYATVQIREKPYVVNIVRDRFTVDAAHTYVVLRKNSDSVLGYGSAPDLKTARKAAVQMVRGFSSRKRKPRASRRTSKEV
jgi:hypothetical protein